MAEYTPTTGEVRALYVAGTPAHRVTVPRGNAEFDRWLAQVRADEREKVARAIEVKAEQHDGGRWHWALHYAARIAREGGDRG